MKSFTSWIKILFINLGVFLFLLFLTETALRALWTGSTCLKKDCDFSRLFRLQVYDVPLFDKNIGLSEFNDSLGHQPKPGFKEILNSTGWDGKLVSITDKGYRSNGNMDLKIELESDKKILAIGDSFTFGDQVSDHETWPACLERNIKRTTINAGVFGYGSAQAVKRAAIVNQFENIDTIIFSILLRDDFSRERLEFRYGLPRPAVVFREGNVAYANVPPYNAVGTKWNPREPYYLLAEIKRNSMLGKKIIDVFSIDVSGMRRNELHRDAASLQQIIEFTMMEFSNIKVPFKFIVLQYSEKDMPELSSEVQNIRTIVSNLSKNLSIPLVDTFDSLKLKYVYGKQKIWNGHHTVYGNSLVCAEILKAFSN